MSAITLCLVCHRLALHLTVYSLLLNLSLLCRVVGAYHGVAFNKSKAGGEAFSFAIYSDDNGDNWTWADGHAYDVGPSTGECQIAPAPNGSLIMRTRTGRHTPPAFSWSNDNGTSWSKPLFWTSDMMHAAIFQHWTYNYTAKNGTKEHVAEYGPFPGSNTQGSIARLPDSDLLVTSTPFGGGPGRENMTTWVSADSGKSWNIDKHVYSGYSGYSALVGLNATHYGLLWEVSGHPPSGNPPGSGDPFRQSYTVLQVGDNDGSVTDDRPGGGLKLKTDDYYSGL